MNATIAKKAGITERHLYYLLEGRRHASPGIAANLERITGLPRELWVFPERAPERRAAWKKFKEAQP